MTMKPYVVRITLETHIFAENEEEAKKEAESYPSLGDPEVVKGSAEIVHRYVEYTIPKGVKFMEPEEFLRPSRLRPIPPTTQGPKESDQT